MNMTYIYILCLRYRFKYYIIDYFTRLSKLTFCLCLRKLQNYSKFIKPYIIELYNSKFKVLRTSDLQRIRTF